MMFAAQMAWRYLASSKLQTALLVAGVALGVTAFVFITALIQGLANFLTKETIGQIAHVSIEPPTRQAAILIAEDGARVVAARPVSTVQRRQIRAWQGIVAIAAREPGVTAISAEVAGDAFLVRGEAVAPIAVRGVEPARLDAISLISPKIVAGSADLSSDGVLIGETLANELGVTAGTPVLLRTDRGGERLISVRGIYRTGVGSLDERVAFIAQRAARPLFNLPEGVNRIDIKLEDPNTAPRVAERLSAATNLKVIPWQEKNRQLQSALEGQGRSGNLIQMFAIISILIIISSALLLATYRRRGEIGIMRSFGVSRAFVAQVFVFQGIIVGALGAAIGCGLGFWLTTLLTGVRDSQGEVLLPVAPEEGGYVLVTTLTIVGAAIAALLPARQAARIDPVEAIHQ
jgi:lipoprotein-releasing system permease protein